MISQLDNGAVGSLAILGRTLLSSDKEMSLERARFLVGMRFSEHDIARMNKLAAKACDGALTADEQAELADYQRAGHLLETLKSTARRRLREAGEFP